MALTPPLPPHVVTFLGQPNFAVLATLRPDGSPNSAVSWYEWVDDRLVFSMDDIRQRVGWIRNDPRVSATIVDVDNWYRHVTLTGRVVSLEPDHELECYYRLHRRYRGTEAAKTDRRRMVARAEIDHWYSWDATQATSTSRSAPFPSPARP